jgi:hypothetical protein
VLIFYFVAFLGLSLQAFAQYASLAKRTLSGVNRVIFEHFFIQFGGVSTPKSEADVIKKKDKKIAVKVFIVVPNNY